MKLFNVQMADTNPESYEVAMSHFLDAIPILSETSKIKDGLGLEERVQADGRVNPSVIFESGSLRPDIVAPPKRKDIGRPTSALREGQCAKNKILHHMP